MITKEEAVKITKDALITKNLIKQIESQIIAAAKSGKTETSVACVNNFKIEFSDFKNKIENLFLNSGFDIKFENMDSYRKDICVIISWA